MMWLRASFWIGAAFDAVVAAGMLHPPLLASMLGIHPAPSSVEVRAALAMACALMVGWTTLLLWASVRPVERRAILLLTVCPVVVGLALATLYAAVTAYVPLAGAATVWTAQLLLSTAFLAAYRRASRIDALTAGDRGRPNV